VRVFFFKKMKSRTSPRLFPLPQPTIIIGSALLIQLLGRYHAHDFKIGYLYYSWILLRILFPVIILYFLKTPFTQLGLKPPTIDRFLKRLIPLSIGGLFGIYLAINASPGYLATYANHYGPDCLTRLTNFSIFTLSTLTGWEFLHRGFLLLGITYLLTEKEGLDRGQAGGIALLFVWVFEVLFHFVKPSMEAFGMLLGSPFLSYITLRTGSIWPAFLLHLGVELVFIISI